MAICDEDAAVARRVLVQAGALIRLSPAASMGFIRRRIETELLRSIGDLARRLSPGELTLCATCSGDGWTLSDPPKRRGELRREQLCPTCSGMCVTTPSASDSPPPSR